MENQPIIARPWFRQLSQPRMEPPPPQPTETVPTPPLRRAAFPLLRPPVPTSQPQPQTSPPQPQPRPSTPSPPTPEPQLLTPPPPSTTVGVVEPRQPLKPLSTSVQPPSPRFTTAALTATPQSPTIIKPSNPTPPPSPKANKLQTLPPSQQKSVIVQEEATKGEGGTNSQPTKREGKNAALDGRGPMKGAAWKKDESEMSVITIAGENMGAYMDLGSPPNYNHHGRKHQDRHSHNHQQDTEPVKEEGKSGDKKEKAAKAETKKKPIASLTNSNVQSVNNSILFNTSCTTRSPGVHITLASHRASRAPVTHPSKGGVHLSKETPAENHGH